MSKRMAHSPRRFLPMVLVLALLALMSDLASAQTRAVTTSVIEWAKLTASDGATGDRFGHSVASSGDTVIVGAIGDTDYAGSAYVFQRNAGGPGNWGQVAKLTASDGAAGDRFGMSVSISGDTVVVGARLDDDNGDDSGSAYLFERDEGGPGNWGQVVKLTASDGSFWAIFGVSVSISGETAVVGARTLSNGSAYLFERDAGGAGNWGEVAKLTASDGALNDDFGTAVSIGGNTIVIGAYADDDNGEDSGSAYVFYRFEPVSWIYLPVVLRGY
jgi:hypothetical protein